MKVKINGTKYDTGAESTLDAVRFERHYGIAYGEAFHEGAKLRMEWMAFMTWSGLQRAGVAVGEFDDAFLASLEFVVDDDEPAAPAAAPLGGEAQPS